MLSCNVRRSSILIVFVQLDWNQFYFFVRRPWKYCARIRCLKTHVGKFASGLNINRVRMHHLCFGSFHRYVQQKTNSPVDMRVGIHTGAILAGILGQRQWYVFDFPSAQIHFDVVVRLRNTTKLKCYDFVPSSAGNTMCIRKMWN